MKPTDLQTRLVAETLRRLPDAATTVRADEAARSRAVACEGDAETRLLAWIRNSAPFPELAATCQRLMAPLRWSVVMLLVLAALLGWLAAATSLGSGDPVNLLTVLAALVGVPTLLLMLWLLVLAASLRPGGGTAPASPGLLASLPLHLTRWLTAHDAPRRAALTGLTSLLTRPPAGRWLFGSLTHGFWLMFSVGALGCLLLRLTTVQYDFVWGTTLASDARAMQLLGALTWLPQQLGLPAPDQDTVAASRLGAGNVGAQRRLWGQFLLLAVAGHVLLPRMLLLAACALLARRALQRTPLDLGQPFYQRLLLDLQRASQPQTPVDAKPARSLGPVVPPPSRTDAGAGQYLAVVGLELDPAQDWPPPLQDRSGLALNNISDRRSRATALEELGNLAPAPALLLVVSSALRTPDRGTMDLLSELGGAARAPVFLWLLDREQLEARGAGAADQLEAWHERAQRAGVTAVETGDWNQLCKVSRQQLEARLHTAQGSGS